MSKSKNVLFGLTGSIAAYKSCYVISKLVQNGYDVQTVCTANAFEFVGRATLEGLTGKPVFSDNYEPGQMMNHIDLAKWADAFVICPATAKTINELSHGLGSSPVNTLFLAYDLKKPVLLAPAMNQQMFKHPTVQRSLGLLKEWGVKVLPTDEGHQACGDVGEGRLLDPEIIYKNIVEVLP